MAAPTKMGLDYFPFDVDLLSDIKLRRCKLKYGCTATITYIALLSILYKDKGYYIDYSEKHKDDVVWEVLELMQGKYQPAAETVTRIIEDLVACDLFDGVQFKSETITSVRAQKVYYRSTVDRKAVCIDFDKWLLTEYQMRAISEKSVILLNFINQPNNTVNQTENTVNKTDNPQSKVKESKVKKIKESKPSPTHTKVFIQPNIEEVRKYCTERKNNIDVQRFIDYYMSNGWMVGKNHMKDWKAAVRRWEKNEISMPRIKQNSFNNYTQRQYDYDMIEKKMQKM